MFVPNFNPLQYGDSTTFNTLANKLASGATDFVSKVFSPGLVRPDALSITTTGLTVGYNAPSPFGVMFGSGRFATAHGSQNGVDSQTGTVSFSSILPVSGTITGYLAVSYNQVLQSPISIPGPPVGNPGYNPNYVPVVGYTSNTDSLVFSAVTGLPDNFTTFEICRFALTSSTTGLTPVYTSQYQSVPFNALQTSGTPSAGTFNIPSNTSYVNWALNGTVSAVLPSAASDGVPGTTYNFINLSGNSTAIQTNGENIYLLTTGATSLVVPSYATVSVNSIAGSWRVVDGTILLANAETYAASAASTAQNNAETYARGTSVIGSPNGYMILPNGFMLQYFHITVNAANPGTTLNYNFPYAFPTAYITSWTNPSDPTAYGGVAPIATFISSGSNTAATFNWTAGATITFSCFVLGY